MNARKQLGIWMDHSNAILMDASSDAILTTNIESDFTDFERRKSLKKGEYAMHSTEQHDRHAYYQKLSEAIKNYDRVVLFGPTSAKEELLNLLKADRHFEKKQIDVKNADQMTKNQLNAFVKNHFKQMLEHQ